MDEVHFLGLICKCIYAFHNSPIFDFIVQDDKYASWDFHLFRNFTNQNANDLVCLISFAKFDTDFHLS